MKTISYKRHRFPPRVIKHSTVKSSFYTLNLRAPSRHEKPRVTNPLVRAIYGLGLKPFRPAIGLLAGSETAIRAKKSAHVYQRARVNECSGPPPPHTSWYRKRSG